MSIGRVISLLERDHEVEALVRAVAAAEQGAGRVVIIEGPGGIGKTRLLETARELANSGGLRVMAARAHELEHEFPYGVAKQLYEPVIAAATSDEHKRWLSGGAGLVPALLGDSAGSTPGDGEGTFARLHALYWLFANVAADGPVVALVDDAHWADDPSLRFLGFLARRAGELRLTLVVATRPGRMGAQPLLRDLVADPVSVRLRPAPLSSRAVAAWIAADAGVGTDAVFADACREVTNGYPFLVSELLREIRSQGLSPDAHAAGRVRELGPEAIASVVLVRLSRLSTAAGAFARALAVLDDGAYPTLAAEIAALAEDEVGPALDALVGSDVVTPGIPLRFVHPIIRSAILAELPHRERVAKHRLAARVLHEDGASLQQVAAHLLAAEETGEPWAIDTLRAAADDALSRGGQETAVKYLERVVAAAPRAERAAVLADLGRAELLVGRHAGLQHLRQAIELTDDPLTAARAGLALGSGLRSAGSPTAACVALEAALAQDPADRKLQDTLRTELLSVSYLSAAARERLRPQLAVLHDASSRPGGAHAAFVLAARAQDAIGACDPVDQAASLARQALAASRPSNGLTIAFAASALVMCDCFDEATAFFAELMGATRRQGWAVRQVDVLSLRAMLHYRRGGLAESEEDASEALAIAAEFDHPARLGGYAENARNLTALERGDREELERLVSGIDSRAVNDGRGGQLHSRGLLRAATGDLRGGLADVLRAGQVERSLDVDNPSSVWWRSDAALILMRLDERVEARRLAEEELELARKFGAGRALGIALRAVALTHAPSPDPAMLAQATEVLRGSGAELEHARALTDLGAALHRAGRRTEARDPLRRGYHLAVRCGAKVLADAALQALVAAGARPRRRALSGVESLTPSELRVAELAAGGDTNREIAEALFVTEKTVETHLSHVYPKLHITSRAELPTKLRRTDRSNFKGSRPRISGSRSG
jgi:DNA-binding CsgD family transcriptional regulator